MLHGLLESLPSINDISPARQTPRLQAGEPLKAAVGLMAPVSGCSTPIARLPPETLEEIIAFVPQESHLDLSLVSRLFHALTLRHIYADIVLHSTTPVARCCRTLVYGNPLAASSVRRFEISYPPNPRRPFLQFYQLIGKALEKIVNVHTLVLLASDPHYASVLTPRVTLPRLVHLNSQLSLSDTSVGAFLARHRRISYLQLNSHSAPIPPTPDITLPQLEYFSGNSLCVAPVIQGGAALRAAFITWDDIDEPVPEPEEALAALERSCTDTLNFLGCRRQGWNIDLLEQISTHLPHIYALSLTNLFSSSDAAFPQPLANLDAIGRCLSRFSCLQRLVISCVNVWYPWEEGVLQMDEAFDTVTLWGALCPSLVECTLPQSNRIRWIRVCDDLWLPDLSLPPDHTHTGMRWLWARLREKSYAGWERLVSSIPSRQHRRRLTALQHAALSREYTDDGVEDGAAAAVRGVRLGSVGWFDDEDSDESGSEDDSSQ